MWYNIHIQQTKYIMSCTEFLSKNQTYTYEVYESFKMLESFDSKRQLNISDRLRFTECLVPFFLFADYGSDNSEDNVFYVIADPEFRWYVDFLTNPYDEEFAWGHDHLTEENHVVHPFNEGFIKAMIEKAYGESEEYGETELDIPDNYKEICNSQLKLVRVGQVDDDILYRVSFSDVVDDQQPSDFSPEQLKKIKSELTKNLSLPTEDN